MATKNEPPDTEDSHRVAACNAEAEAIRFRKLTTARDQDPRPAQLMRMSYSEFQKCKPLDFKARGSRPPLLDYEGRERNEKGREPRPTNPTERERKPERTGKKNGREVEE
ncbi:hypothetical protein Tco_0374963 [Tanacetum coccineum]